MIVVQIGANRGNDDFTEIIKNKYIEKLILVEPLDIHNEKLNECYKHITNKHIENIIITDDENINKSKIYFHKLDGIEYGNNFELASLNKQHSLNIRSHYNENDLIEKELKSLTLNKLFEKYDLFKIDLLFIDTEGYDEKILKSIDFNRFDIEEIYYENLHCDINSLRTFLEKKNYKVTPHVLLYGWSDKAEKNKKYG
jgi:FkbM family methyltransferase